MNWWGSIAARIRKALALESTGNDRPWTEWVSGDGKTAAGTRVTESTATGVSAYYRGVSLVSMAVAGLPFHVYDKSDPSDRRRLDTNPVDLLLNDVTYDADGLDALTFREVATSHLIMWGNAYAKKVFNGVGIVVGLEPFHPSAVEVEKDRNTKVIRYTITDVNGQKTSYTRSQMFHVRNLGGDCLTGWSTLKLAREALGLSMAIEKFGATFFGNNARPAGVFKSTAPYDIEGFRKQWNAAHQGPDKANRIAPLPFGMEFQDIGIPPEDAQFLETRQFQVAEIGRFLGVPPHLLYDMDRATWNNAEAMGLEFVTYSLRAYLKRWEVAVRTQLLRDEMGLPTTLYAEHNTADFLKADLNARFTAYATARQWGWMSANDVLKRENEPNIGEQGDIYLQPSNMVDASEPPEAPEPVIPEAPSGPPDDEEPEADQEDQSRMESVRHATEAALRAAIDRLALEESVRLNRAAKHPEQFCGWIDQNVEYMRQRAREDVHHAFIAWASADRRWNPHVATVYADLVRETCEELASTSPADELAANAQLVGLAIERSRANDVMKKLEAGSCTSN